MLNVLPRPPTRSVSSIRPFGPIVNVTPESFLARCWLAQAPSNRPATSGSPGPILVSLANAFASTGSSDSRTEMSGPFGAV